MIYLRDYCELTTQLVGTNVSDGLAPKLFRVNRDSPVGGFEESEEGVHQRALSRTSATNDSDLLACANRSRDRLENELVRIAVVTGDALKLDLALPWPVSGRNASLPGWFLLDHCLVCVLLDALDCVHVRLKHTKLHHRKAKVHHIAQDRLDRDPSIPGIDRLIECTCHQDNRAGGSGN